MRSLPHSLFCAAAVAAFAAPGAAFAQDARAEALAFLNLQTSGSGLATWASHSADGTRDVFSGVSFSDGDGVLAVDQLIFTGLRMENGEPIFDSMTFEGMTFNEGADAGAGGTDAAAPNGGKGPPGAAGAGGGVDEPQSVTAARFVVAGPNALTAAGLARSMFRDEGDALEFEGLEAYSFQEISLQDVAMTFLDDSGQPVTMGMGAIAVRGWGEGQIGSMSIDGIVLDGATEIEGQLTDIDFELNRFAVEGMPLAGLQAMIDAVESEDMSLASESALFNPFIPAWTAYEFSGMAMNVGGVLLTLQEMSGQVTPSDRGLEYVDSMQSLALSFDPAQPLGAQAMIGVAMLGLDRIELNLSARQVADEANDRFYSEEYRLSMTDGFIMDLDYDMSGVGEYVRRAAELQSSMGPDFDSSATAPEDFEAMLEPLIIDHFGLRFEDQGLAEQVLRLAGGFLGAAGAAGGAPPSGAADDKGPGAGGAAGAPAQGGGVGSMLAGQIRANAPPGPGAANDFAMSLANAVETFVNNPNVFTIRMDPEPAVSIAELAPLENDPNALITRLGLTVSAE